MSVFLEQQGRQEKVMENVTRLEAGPAGVTVSTLFEEPMLVAGARVRTVDFLAGTLVLVPSDPATAAGCPQEKT